ncbi:DUF2861 family protein [Vibrio sonorensis]|uniref:DUF2861 family protein n=1 Tax=Vibrio sonorensis TaxID=1004316 RepID=UPI0008D9E13E|nr:DUF2861 family protein [Vibrio sonorensis]
MKSKTLFALALVSGALNANTVPWFENNSPLIQAHKNLLNNDLPAMFSSLVEVWQLEKNRALAPHLNDILVQSLAVDCGKSLDTRTFPEWIDSVVVRRTEIQSPGRDTYRTTVEVTTSKELKDVTMSQWVSKVISNDDLLTEREAVNGGNVYSKRYNLNSRLPMGLYRVDITSRDNTTWSSWLLIGEPNSTIGVRWQSKDSWNIEQSSLLNPHCPLPKQKVSLYDYIDGAYHQLWNQVSESDYPTSIDTSTVPAGRYVLAVSMNQQRWQGPIIIEQSQIINKTYDVSVEE